MIIRDLNYKEAGDVLSESAWRFLIIASAAAVLIFSVYCLSHYITIIFMHLYYFPIVLLAYRYRYRGFVLAVLLSLSYVVLVAFYHPELVEVTGALDRFAVFVVIAGVVAFLFERLEAARKSLQASEENYRTVFENTGTAMVVVEEDQIISLANTEFVQLSGFSRDEIEGKKSWTEFVVKEDLERMLAQHRLRRQDKEKAFRHYEFRFLKRAGEIRNIYLSIDVIPGTKKSVASLLDITERKKAEGALAQKAALLAQAEAISHKGSWRMVLETGRVTWSDEMYNIFGLDRTTFSHDVGEAIALAVHPEDRAKLDELNSAVLRDGLPRPMDYRIVHPDGTVRWVHAQGEQERDETGQVVALAGFVLDITDRKQAEAALRESEGKFRTVLENVPDLVLVHRDGVILYVNPAMIQTMGYTPEEVINTPIIGYIVPEYHGRVADAVRKRTTTAASVEPYEIELLTKAGGRLNVIVRGTMIEFGGSPAVLNVLTDITERKHAEAALHETEERYRSLFDRSLDCVYIHDFLGKFIEANPSALKLLGYTGEEIRSVNFTSLLTEDQIPLALNVIQEVITTGTQKESSEYRVRRKDGNYVDVETTATLLYDEGNPYAIQGFAHDITERKKTEERLKKFNEELERGIAERTARINASLEEKVVLLREIHHRVKNNLQIIISLLNLQSRYIEDESVKQIIRESQNRLKAMSLVHERLYMSPDISKIDFEGYVGFLARNLFDFYGVKRQNITIKTDISKVSVGINTAIPIGLIVNELLSNSLKYAFPDGRKGEIAISVTKEDSTISLRFKDNGVGIPEDKDWRDAKSLGLRIVISLVEQLSGTIELDRQGGTAFTIVVKEKE